MLRLAAFPIIVALVAFGSSASAQNSVYDDLLSARKAFDAKAFTAAKERLIVYASSHTEDYRAQYEAAEGLRLWATSLRNERNTRTLSSKEIKMRRTQQADEATRGIPYAERAVELAQTDADAAQAHRVLGELYSHLISGMISGMRNGPKAKSHINRGLALAPGNTECKRAIALMYLHNPPFNGGDVSRAIKTFAFCAAEVPESDIYPVLLAMAYRKAKKPELALSAAKMALEVNPSNADARAMVSALDNG